MNYVPYYSNAMSHGGQSVALSWGAKRQQQLLFIANLRADFPYFSNVILLVWTKLPTCNL